MLRYRKKPVVIEAVEYAGKGNLHARYKGQVPKWMWDAFRSGVLEPTNGTDPLIIHTLEGDMTLEPGAWLIRGVKGELYACRDDIFQATYEPVLEED